VAQNKATLYNSAENAKFFRTRYRLFGPELIPVYRQSIGQLSDFLSYPTGGRLPLLSARLAVTFSAEGRHPLLGDKSTWV